MDFVSTRVFWFGKNKYFIFQIIKSLVESNILYLMNNINRLMVSIEPDFVLVERNIIIN